MNDFKKEFHTLNYVITHSDKILLVAHTRPDPDAVGSVLAMKYYLENIGKDVTISCYSPFPEFLIHVLEEEFVSPEELTLSEFDAIIGCDSIDRGFDTVIQNVSDDQITIGIDHHHDITTAVDVRIIDADYAATCEIVYHFFSFVDAKITKPIATALLLGILGDTGSFRHANTSSRVLHIAADLMNHGAQTASIVEKSFANNKMSTLKLWGHALQRARINPENGMIMTALTQKDLEETHTTSEDVKEIASILSTVPNTRFSLIIFQADKDRIKGSLRAEKEAGIDVSAIAHKLGGGGHRLASGFEINGTIEETKTGWHVV